jgi:hypothetical protein
MCVGGGSGTPSVKAIVAFAETIAQDELTGSITESSIKVAVRTANWVRRSFMETLLDWQGLPTR